MTPKQLNLLCMDAISHSGTHFDSDQLELTNRGMVNVSKLHKGGYLKVIQYWNDTDTIGGSLLWDSGYYELLDVNALRLFEEVEGVIARAIKKHFKYSQ